MSFDKWVTIEITATKTITEKENNSAVKENENKTYENLLNVNVDLYHEGQLSTQGYMLIVLNHDELNGISKHK